MDILSDENCEGQVKLISYAFERLEWQELISVSFLKFKQVGLERGSNDETVWQFCQLQNYLLLTGNRTAEGEDSLEMVLRRAITETSLPVLTIGDVERIKTDPAYCERCAESIANIVWGIIHHNEYLGTPRVYIPLPTL